MGNILQIGFTAEGTTDQRFLTNIIRKTFEHAVFDCHTDIEVYEPEFLGKEGDDFLQQIESIAQDYSYFHVICIHCDSDNPRSTNVLQNKIIPAIEAVNRLDDACKNIVAIVPVQMTEAWLLADINLLKSKIGTLKSNRELGLPIRVNQVERLANPKEVISNAIRISQENLARRRRRLLISNLYSPVSQEISVDMLSQLPSYMTFMTDVRRALTNLNYIA